MTSYTVTPQAQEDIQDIWGYIAQDNPLAADRVEAELYSAFDKLAGNPYLGHTRADLTDKPVRFWPLYSYQVIYDPESRPLLILQILSGYRNIPALLEKP